MMVVAVFDKVRSLVGFFEACPMLLMGVFRSTLYDAEGRVRFVQTRPCCFWLRRNQSHRVRLSLGRLLPSRACLCLAESCFLPLMIRTR